MLDRLTALLGGLTILGIVFVAQYAFGATGLLVIVLVVLVFYHHFSGEEA